MHEIRTKWQRRIRATDSKVEIIKYENSCHKALELLTKQRNWQLGGVFSDVQDMASEEIFFGHYCSLKNIFQLSNFYQFYKIFEEFLESAVT